MKRFLCLLIAFSFALSLSSCGSGKNNSDGIADKSTQSASQVNTNSIIHRLQTGMTYVEVRDLIGADGELTNSADIGTNAMIMFQGGELTSKSQYGLKYCNFTKSRPWRAAFLSAGIE